MNGLIQKTVFFLFFFNEATETNFFARLISFVEKFMHTGSAL